VNWDDFAQATVQTDGAAISVNYGGTGPAVLLLHGFPETNLMWREIALRVAEQFFVVAADLRGYGDSSTPPSTSDHMPYSKRAMANDMIQVMAHLGHDRFVVAGHDRGGRVAYPTAQEAPAHHVPGAGSMERPWSAVVLVLRPRWPAGYMA
jgi:haloacetate dehalogenase